MITVRRLLLAGAAASLLLFTGCPQGPGPYADYAGVNLIADQVVFGFPAAGRWTTDAAAVYENFAFEGGALPPGSPAGAEVWRLEMKNLVPDGDFESSTPTLAPNGWVSIGGALLETITGTLESLDGQTMHVRCDDDTQLVDFDLRDGVHGATDGFPLNNTYTVRFDYRANKDRLVFEYNNSPNLPLPEGDWTWSADGDPGPASTFTGRYAFPPAGLVPTVTVRLPVPDEQHFFFNSLLDTASHKIEVYIDNVRLIRTNQSYFARMSIADGEAALPLVAGTYRFSIWVKLDPETTPLAAGLNRFAARSVELSLKRTYQSSAGEVSTLTAVKSFHDGVGGFDLAGGAWQLVSVELPGREWQTAGATVSMEIGISPTDETFGASGMDCGSVLVAAPSLELLPDTF